MPLLAARPPARPPAPKVTTACGTASGPTTTATVHTTRLHFPALGSLPAAAPFLHGLLEAAARASDGAVRHRRAADAGAPAAPPAAAVSA